MMLSFSIGKMNEIIVLGHPGCEVQGLAEVLPVLVQQPHVRRGVVEGQAASLEVDVEADPAEAMDRQRRLRVAVPGEDASAVSPHAPGQGAPGDAASALLPLALDSFVCESHVRALPAQLGFQVVPALVQALGAQGLLPVVEALGVLGVAVLPGAGVRQLPVVLRHAQEAMGGVGVECQTSPVCKGQRTGRVRHSGWEKWKMLESVPTLEEVFSALRVRHGGGGRL